MRMIDGDKLTENAFKNPISYNAFCNLVKRQPTVDAVPVVRCRDCEHKDRESGFCHGRGWPMQLVPDDGFCDKGKGR